MIQVPDPIEVPTVDVETAGAWFGLSRSSAYAAVQAGQIPSIRLGRRLVVPVAAVRRLLLIDVEEPV